MEAIAYGHLVWPLPCVRGSELWASVLLVTSSGAILFCYKDSELRAHARGPIYFEGGWVSAVRSSGCFGKDLA